jgi:hypothetical protein
MNLHLPSLAGAALVVALAPFARADDAATAYYKFRTPPVNSMGITTLEELRGKPVIIDFWGTR